MVSISDFTLGKGGPHLLHPHPSASLPFRILARPGPGLCPESAGGPALLAQEAEEQLERLRICLSPGSTGLRQPRSLLLPGWGMGIPISRRRQSPTSQDRVERRLTAGGLGLWGFPAIPLVPTAVSRHCFPSHHPRGIWLPVNLLAADIVAWRHHPVCKAEEVPTFYRKGSGDGGTVWLPRCPLPPSCSLMSLLPPASFSNSTCSFSPTDSPASSERRHFCVD